MQGLKNTGKSTRDRYTAMRVMSRILITPFGFSELKLHVLPHDHAKWENCMYHAVSGNLGNLSSTHWLLYGVVPMSLLCLRYHSLTSIEWKTHTTGNWWANGMMVTVITLGIYQVSSDTVARSSLRTTSVPPDENKLLLTHWGRDKMDAISQMTYSNAFCWMKSSEFRISFHLSVFIRIQLTITQLWFR